MSRYEVPIDSFQIVVPMRSLDLEGVRAFMSSRLASLGEDGCVMVRYEPCDGTGCSVGLAFAPNVVMMGFGTPGSAKNMAVDGDVEELADYVVGMVVASDVMDG